MNQSLTTEILLEWNILGNDRAEAKDGEENRDVVRGSHYGDLPE